MSTSTNKIQFNTQSDFYRELIRNVNDYFKANNISKYGNRRMIIKTICMFAFYFAPFSLLFLDFGFGLWSVLVLYALMGIGKSGIGLSVMHDANHNSFSKNQKVNKWMSYSMNIVGGSSINWKIQHNVLHHTFTNVHGHDEDINAPFILRFSPHQKYYLIHKFQFIYSWFFYGFLTLGWIMYQDYGQLIGYNKRGLLKSQKTTFSKEFTILILTKISYLAYIIALPMIFGPAVWWSYLVGFAIMHYVAGFILSIIFQPAHVIEETEFPLTDESGKLATGWAEHQLMTTCNFARNSRIFSWFVGGLNFQVEHHLFPNICHVHYPGISAIVKATAEKFNLPYYSQRTFLSALVAHGKMLYRLGNPKLAT